MGSARIKLNLKVLERFLSIGLMASLGGSNAFAANVNGASGSYAASPTTPAWTDSSKYVECGQDCLYQKANENVTLQAIYLVKKMDNLQKVLDGGEKDDFGQVVTELKLYCPEVAQDSQKEEDANLCYKRYVQTQLPILRAMKTTLVQNEDTTARLKTQQSAIGGVDTSKSAAFQDSTPGTRKAQTPEFTREQDLLTSKAGNDRLNYLATNRYADWAAKVASLAPKPEDFPLTVKVPKDPSDPSSMSINKIVRDNNGVAKPDMAAYLRAKIEFDTHVKGTVDNKPVDLDLKKVARYKETMVGNKSKSLPEVDTSINPKDRKAKPTDLETLSFQQARNLAVESEARLFARGVLHTQTFAGAPKDRKVSSAPANDKLTNKNPTQGSTPAAQGGASSRTNAITPEPELGYNHVVTEGLKKTKEDVMPTLPASGANSVYSVTLSPEELDKSIEGFQSRADQIK